MNRGFVVSALIVFMVFGAMTTTASVQAQTASPTIRIRSDGSVDPASTPIRRDGETYTFTADVWARGIVVERANIVLDGAGFVLRGPYDGEQTLWIIGEGPDQEPVMNETWSIGVDLQTDEVVGLTVRNLRIENFSIGMYLWAPSGSCIGNTISDTIVAVLVSGNNCSIVGNYFGGNKNGVFFGSSGTGNIPVGIAVYNNSFVNNTRQLGGCICLDYNLTEEVHSWDNGALGNFWSDYNGTDADGDGIGDVPYEIDVLNKDRFPLMAGLGVTPTPTPTQPLNPETLWHLAAGVFVGAAVIAAVAALLWRRKKCAVER